MKYSSISIANYFLSKGGGSDIKLNSLTYVAYCVFLAVYGERLVDSQPLVWKRGPVFSDLFLFGEYGERIHVKHSIIWRCSRLSNRKIPTERRVVHALNVAWKKYGRASDSALNSTLIKDGTPWKTCYDEIVSADKDIKQRHVVRDEVIKSYYKNILDIVETK